MRRTIKNSAIGFPTALFSFVLKSLFDNCRPPVNVYLAIAYRNTGAGNWASTGGAYSRGVININRPLSCQKSANMVIRVRPSRVGVVIKVRLVGVPRVVFGPGVSAT